MRGITPQVDLTQRKKKKDRQTLTKRFYQPKKLLGNHYIRGRRRRRRRMGRRRRGGGGGDCGTTTTTTKLTLLFKRRCIHLHLTECQSSLVGGLLSQAQETPTHRARTSKVYNKVCRAIVEITRRVSNVSVHIQVSHFDCEVGQSLGWKKKNYPAYYAARWSRMSFAALV